MSKHRANVEPRTNPVQVPGRHRAEAPPVVHWYATCVAVGEHDTLATDQSDVDCEACLIQLRTP